MIQMSLTNSKYLTECITPVIGPFVLLFALFCFVVPCGLWDLSPQPGIEPVSPALAVGFFTIELQGSSLQKSLSQGKPPRLSQPGQISLTHGLLAPVNISFITLVTTIMNCYVYHNFHCESGQFEKIGGKGVRQPFWTYCTGYAHVVLKWRFPEESDTENCSWREMS